MKNISPILICALLAIQVSAQTLLPTAHFKFDGSLAESISNLSPDSSFANFSYGSDEIGTTGAALEIASGAYTMPDPVFTQFGLGDFSMSVWLKRTASLWPTEYLITKNGSDGYFRFRYNGFFDQMNFYFRPSLDSAEISVGTPSQSVNTVWNLYTVSVDRDSSIQMYLNNTMVFSKDISHLASYPADFTGGLLRFGTHDILLNDLTFFEKALTLEEVTAIFDNELSLDVLSPQELVLYPNPASTLLKIKSNHPIDEEYEIYSMSGQITQSGRVQRAEIDVSNLSPGQYLLQISNRSFPILIK